MPHADNTQTNIALIDGQNLYAGTRQDGWTVNHRRFRVYLQEKYRISKAYYFLGFFSEAQKELYSALQAAGFVLEFKKHSDALKSDKKGNVDSDIIFVIMRKLVENERFNAVFIVSGDGDYKKLVDFLIEKNRFGKMLFPSRRFISSLYRSLPLEFYDYLDAPKVKEKICHARTGMAYL